MNTASFDALSEEQQSDSHLIRLSPHFQVVALALPIPP